MVIQVIKFVIKSRQRTSNGDPFEKDIKNNVPGPGTY